MTTPSDPFSQDPLPPPGGSPYGQPPAGPGQPGASAPGYGTPPPSYGQPSSEPPSYGQQPYGSPAYGAPTGARFGQPGGPALAGWGARAQSAFVDFFGPSLAAGLVGALVSQSLGNLLTLVALGWALYNAYLQGTTGQSVGKRLAGLRLLREADGQVIGGGLGIGRYFLHVLDALPCYLGFLWPLWDAKKQTFADKIAKSVVVQA